MPLPEQARNHYGVSLSHNGEGAAHARYAVQGDRLLFFGDGAAARLTGGDRVHVAIGEIGGKGDAAAVFDAIVEDVDAQSVSDDALLRLLEHVALGLTMEEVGASIEGHRRARRVLALRP